MIASNALGARAWPLSESSEVRVLLLGGHGWVIREWDLAVAAKEHR